MTAPVFVDTNVLFYALDDSDVKKQEAARLWRAELWRSRRGRISFQVLQEFWVKVTKKVPSVQQEPRSEGPRPTGLAACRNRRGHCRKRVEHSRPL